MAGQVWLTDGDNVLVTCSSLHIEVLVGPVEVAPDADTTVTVPSGAVASIVALPGGGVEIVNDESSIATVSVEAHGALVTVAPGAASSFDAADSEGDREYSGDTTITEAGRVKGNVTIWNGTLTVLGTIEGNVAQRGSGGVEVNGGFVKGNVDERGDGGVLVSADGTVEGNIFERNTGDVDIGSGGGEALVKGNVCERGAGAVNVGPDAMVEGNISC